MSDKGKRSGVTIAMAVFAAATVYLLKDQVLGIHAHYRGQLGIVYWMLAPQALLVVAALLRVLLKDNMEGGVGSLTDLAFVESAGPASGLIGSVIGMREGLTSLSMAATGNMAQAIASIISTVATALSATAWGLGLGLLAWIVRNRMAPAAEKRVKA
jgi:hypothetical protein